MLFNSLSFLLFLPIVYFIYWLLSKKPVKFQNILLLLASYFFYANWDFKFLFLLLFSTGLDYISGIQIERAKSLKIKKAWFYSSIFINLGFLGLFKYYNFFIDSFTSLLSNFGFTVHPLTLNVILPVGISFYTFHGLSYVIDVYKEKIKAEKNVVDYSLFVSFFPLLVAGPIERATHLLPQLKIKRRFNYENTVLALKQILLGLFKKIVIADQCATHVNHIFNDVYAFNGSTLVLGAILFAFQIYGDFSGYSDIALGTARLFGINLLKNFSFPYFSRSISEFWRRWHISLSSWFRDYLYFPLGGSKKGLLITVRNTFIIFLVSGFWHGANWTFIVWGLLHALFIIPSVIFKTNRSYLDIVSQGRIFPRASEIFHIFITFTLVTFTWIFFRAESLIDALRYIRYIFTRNLFVTPKILPINLLVLIALFMIIEWFGRESDFALQGLDSKINKKMRWFFYYILVLTIIYFCGNEQEFIYFQF